MIAQEELAYTAHPAVARKNEDERRLAGATRREGESRALAVVAGAALAVVGATAAMDATRASAASAAPSYAAPFEAREPGSSRLTPSAAVAEAPLGNLAPPVPHSSALSSPAPLLGDVAGIDDGSLPAAPAAANGGMDFRALTSFDGTMTMTAGGLQPVAGAQAAPQQVAQAAAPAPARQPVQWSRPLEWTRVNNLGGANLAGADPRVPN
ncbi:MAG: hypothetical protein M0D55_11950 [Elusimicrobiota bacterium]|nr:MAG: hypothetical protein M0D55_11950 [Elusimicrobiota bacterium]